MGDLETINFNKLACTGVGLTYDTLDLRPLITSEDGFTRLISQYYKFFREAVVADIAFLRSVERHPAIVEFDDAIYQLRTAQQHSDNNEAIRFYRSWTNNQNWQDAADALSQSLRRALSHLSRISSQVRRDEDRARAWQGWTSAAPASVFESVCLDLKVSFSDRRKAFLIRNIERQARTLSVDANVRAGIEEICVGEITKQSMRLPVPYYMVLDRLNLLGRPKARAAILLAYSISASTSLRGEDFIVRVEEAWQVSAA
jgi:hypothetical protein